MLVVSGGPGAVAPSAPLVLGAPIEAPAPVFQDRDWMTNDSFREKASPVPCRSARQRRCADPRTAVPDRNDPGGFLPVAARDTPRGDPQAFRARRESPDRAWRR